MSENGGPNLALEVHWRHFFNAVRGYWPKLTDLDMSTLKQQDFCRRKYDALILKLCDRYAISDSEAKERVNRFVDRFLRPRVPAQLS